MESLFKVTELESRTSLNMNVLDATRTPRVMDLKEVIQSYLDHLREVLLRRSRQRLKKINDRLEVLDGYMKAFLNLDEVIRIIRYEDKPKAELINVFQLTDRQADAILNMRLRALNKLQEIEISNENNHRFFTVDAASSRDGVQTRILFALSQKYPELAGKLGSSV